MIFADRFLAVLGNAVLILIFSLGIFLIPAYFVCWCLLPVALWKACQWTLFLVSFAGCQCLLAFLRETYFYDAAGIWAFCGGICAIFLILVYTVSMAYLCETTEWTVWHITAIALLQLVQALLTCAAA